MRIELQTAAGEHVHHAVIPRFPEPPKVIVWGNQLRVFVLHATEDGPVIYREAAFYALPT